MPRKVDITVYRFNELSEKAQKRAIADEHKAHQEDGWINEAVEERLHNILEERGLPTGDVRWSLGHSQGDGVAFYGLVHLQEYLKRNNLEEKYPLIAKHTDDINIKIRKTREFHSYNHFNTMELELDSRTEEQARAIVEFEQDFLAAIKEVSKELEREGYEVADSYDDDYFAEYLENREIWYHENGEIYEVNP